MKYLIELSAVRLGFCGKTSLEFLQSSFFVVFSAGEWGELLKAGEHQAYRDRFERTSQEVLRRCRALGVSDLGRNRSFHVGDFDTYSAVAVEYRVHQIDLKNEMDIIYEDMWDMHP